MGKNNIEKYSAGYALLKSAANFWHTKFFYRKVIVVGRENINPDDYLIFAPNHQNALMDALAVLFTLKGQPVFLARADIFKKKFIASILYFLKILPVYRIRDGFENVRSNDWVFDKTVEVLKNKNGLVILPEGSHEGLRRLRQLKKGICRIAFQADEATGFKMNIKIVPVGLEFTHYSRIRQVLTVVYGKPIELKDYYDSYSRNQQKAMNELKERLSEEMQKIMVHIESDEDYEAIDELRGIVNGKYSDDISTPKLFRDRILINKLNRLKTSSEELYKKICNLSLNIKKKARSLEIDYRLLEKKKHSISGMTGGILTLLVTLPVLLYGLLFNYIFYLIPNLALKKIIDVQFHSSVKYGISLFLALIFMPLYLILSLFIFSPWWIATAIFLTIPVSGLMAWSYLILYRRIRGGLKIRKLIRNKNPEFADLSKNYEELMLLISKIE
jgi:1-acyl-sn-glycerol-3-phosphate acyltransferase